MNKQELLKKIENAGELKFSCWYKNEFTYSNDKYTIVVKPAYRENMYPTETPQDLLECECATVICEGNVICKLEDGDIAECFV